MNTEEDLELVLKDNEGDQTETEWTQSSVMCVRFWAK